MNYNWTMVTVTYNSGSTLREFWSNASVEEVHEWIVVDNNSSDDSAQVAEGLGARVIRLNENLGFAAANNIGFDNVTTPYVAFVNPDVRVSTDDLQTLESYLQENPNQLLAPQLKNSDGTLQPNGRNHPYFVHKVLNRIFPTAVEGRYTILNKKPGPQRAIWLTGAVVATATQTFSMIGKWNERFFVYYEDTELGLRAAAQDVNSAVIGQINWTHGWKRESTGLNPKGWRLEAQGAFKFYTLYPRYLLPRFPRRPDF